jgi:hypothetical protein
MGDRRLEYWDTTLLLSDLQAGRGGVQVRAGRGLVQV